MVGRRRLPSAPDGADGAARAGMAPARAGTASPWASAATSDGGRHYVITQSQWMSDELNPAPGWCAGGHNVRSTGRMSCAASSACVAAPSARSPLRPSPAACACSSSCSPSSPSSWYRFGVINSIAESSGRYTKVDCVDAAAAAAAKGTFYAGASSTGRRRSSTPCGLLIKSIKSLFNPLNYNFQLLRRTCT